MLAVAALAASALPHAHAAGVSGQGTWETTLQGRDLDGNATTIEAYYDTDLNISWLANASPFWGNWDAAMAWADSLVVGGYSNWRLPKLVDTGSPGCNFGYNGSDCGYNVSTSSSELAHMYFGTLGNKSIPNNFVFNAGPFVNAYEDFWFGVEYALNTNDAWIFDTNDGYQGNTPKSDMFLSAWAVHPGKIGAAVATPSPVPEPQTYALALAGLAVAGAAARKRRKG